jgi:hypothetical protein
VNFETLGNLGDFIGGLAVIISVLYLAVQIRQNTRLLRATALSATTDAYLSFNQLLGADPASAHVFQVGLEDFPSLSEAEQRQFLNLLRIAFTSYQHVHQQFEKGLLDDDVWEQFVRAATALLALPHVRAWWEARKGIFTPQFALALDQAPRSTPPPLAGLVIEEMLKAAETTSD